MRRRLLVLAAGAIVVATTIAEVDHLVPAIAALVGLAAASNLLGEATEDLAVYAGPRWGGLVTALLGGCAELIVMSLALRAGMPDLVKAAIAGSIVANLLVVLGLSAFLGGLKHGTQYFSREGAGIAATMMILSVIALSVPALRGASAPSAAVGSNVTLSEAVALVLIGVYALSLYYSLFWNLDEQAIAGVHRHQAVPTRNEALFSLAIGLAAVTAFSWALIGAAEPLATQHESSIMFMALVAVPLATTVAEHLPAVGTAWANRMDLSLAISTGSGMRLAMLLAPLMVFLSIALGEPMDLVFTQLELGALMASAMVTAFVAIDGQSNWIEGVMLLAVYVIFALAIVWWPATPLM